ncbi:6-pyruvoyl trahydropterin synthase family protein [Geodermatophilus sp. URMC 64]
MYETGTGFGVRAFHVMPGMPPPEGERHSHDYRFDVVVRRENLDERGMVVDLDVLDDALRGAAARVDGQDLEGIVPVEAVTVEAFARWLHGELAGALGALPGATLAVRVWENPDAFGGYTAPLGGTSSA